MNEMNCFVVRARNGSEVAGLFGCQGYLFWILHMHKLVKCDLHSRVMHSYSTSMKLLNSKSHSHTIINS